MGAGTKCKTPSGSVGETHDAGPIQSCQQPQQPPRPSITPGWHTRRVEDAAVVEGEAHVVAKLEHIGVAPRVNLGCRQGRQVGRRVQVGKGSRGPRELFRLLPLPAVVASQQRQQHPAAGGNLRYLLQQSSTFRLDRS